LAAEVNTIAKPGLVAWLFPGQGSQRVGMGQELARADATAAATFREADDALGFPLSQVIFTGPAAELEQTPNQQPAILTVSVAMFRALRASGQLPDAAFVAGHSLGEYSALVAAGALAFADAVRLVRRRGELMQAHGAGSMAAIIGLDMARVRELAAQSGVEVANDNAPGQVVVSGRSDAIAAAIAAAKSYGAKRAIRLPVSGAFHSSFMAPVVDGLRPMIEATAICDAEIPLMSNVSATPIRTAADIRRELLDQICAPVRWTDVTRRLHDDGVRTAYEVGPGKVLTGLVSRIANDMTVTPAETLIAAASR
jgi:[acyl-carrier-protein] S-malonyltransferase